MQSIKRTISLEPYRDRSHSGQTYGTITATSFYINIFLTQTGEDGGQFTDAIYIPKNIGLNTSADYTVLRNKLLASGVTFPFMLGITPVSAETSLNRSVRVTGLTEISYYDNPNKIVTGQTESRIQDNTTYDKINQYVLNFDTNTQTYIDTKGHIVQGVDRITYLGTPLTYVFGADKSDLYIGTLNQRNGLVFQDLTGSTKTTLFSYSGEGWNMTNVSLSALTKEEYLFGVTSVPEVESDLFIDRGITAVFERHLKLSEITNIEELQRYGKGYYNLTQQ